jgi:hypothetical protein
MTMPSAAEHMCLLVIKGCPSRIRCQEIDESSFRFCCTSDSDLIEGS